MIQKKRIRKLNPYKTQLPSTEGAYVVFYNPTKVQLKRAGFGVDMPDGTTILPRIVGRISLYNAEGKNRIRRDKPMETKYRTVEWHWTEWHGRDTIERSDFRDVPYKRYPREFIAPPSIELTLSKNTEGETVVLSDMVSNWRENEELLIHVVNLFLEIFGECTVLDEDKTKMLPASIQRVNWQILPKGEYPFERVKRELQPVLNRIKKGKRSFVDQRLERLNSFKPEYTVIGFNGFSGYIVMAYPDRNLYVLESLLYGNATYVLNHDWEEVTKLTKAEILNKDLHKDRIIHHANWFSKVRDVFDGYTGS